MKEEIKAVLRSYNLEDIEIELMAKDIILAIISKIETVLNSFIQIDAETQFDILSDLKSLGGMVKEKNEF